MTVFSSNPSVISPVISLSSFSPFSRTSSADVFLTKLHNPSLVLRLHSPAFLSSFSSKPIFSNTLVNLSKASTEKTYIYPDPIPEFAEAETLKFGSELRKKLSTNREFGDDLDKVVNACAEIFNSFLQKEYGGPGTLLVEPFTDMLVALKEKNLPGAPDAARAALLWAQNYLDKDWEMWCSVHKKN